MQTMNNFIKNIGDILSNSFKQPLKTFGSIFIMAILFFIIFLLFIIISFTVQSIDKAQNQIHVSFHLKENLPKYKTALLKAKLIKMQRDKQIKDFAYKSSTQILSEFLKHQPERFQFLKDTLGENVSLGSSFTIIPISRDIESIVYFFLNSDFTEMIDTSRVSEEKSKIIKSKRLLEFLDFLNIGIIGVILLIIIGIIITIIFFTYLNFSNKKKEIFIMKLVGASSSFIRTPFLIESIIFTIISLLIGWTLFFSIRYIILTELIKIFSSREEAILMAKEINQMWQEYIMLLPLVIFSIFILNLLITYITVTKLIKTKKIL
jgi:cell division transport system permease protein